VAGKRLWKAVVADVQPGWSLDAKDYAALTEAGRIADQLDALEKAIKKQGAVVEGSTGQPRVHPAIGESRQLRETQNRLLRGIDLEDPKANWNPTSERARKAVNARWDRELGRNRTAAEHG
jgi:hypothetical protein